MSNQTHEIRVDNVNMTQLTEEMHSLIAPLFRPVEFHGDDAEACAYMYSAVRALLLYVCNQSRGAGTGSNDVAGINRTVTSCVQDIHAVRDQCSLLQRNINDLHVSISQHTSPQRNESFTGSVLQQQRQESQVNLLESQIKNLQQSMNLTEQRIRDLVTRYEQDISDLQSESRRGNDLRTALDNRIGNVERTVTERVQTIQAEFSNMITEHERSRFSQSQLSSVESTELSQKLVTLQSRLDSLESRPSSSNTQRPDMKLSDTVHILLEENEGMKNTMESFGERLEMILQQIASSLQNDIELLYSIWDLRKHEVAAICKAGNTRNKISLLHGTPAFADLLKNGVNSIGSAPAPLSPRGSFAGSMRNNFSGAASNGPVPLSPRGSFAGSMRNNFSGAASNGPVPSRGSMTRSPNGSFIGVPLSPRSSMQRQTRHVGIEVAANKSGGVVVTRVVPNSAASEANIMIGDVITAIDGLRVDDVTGMVELVRKSVSSNASFTVTRIPAGINTIPENVRCVMK